MNSIHPHLKLLFQFCCPLFIPREPGNQSLGFEIIGTGVLVIISNQHFLLTANHIIEAAKNHLLYSENDQKAVRFNREIISINEPSTIDLAILDFENKPINSQKTFLSSDHLASDEHVSKGIRCIVTGYPAGKNKTKPKSNLVYANQQAWEFSTIPLSQYKELELNPDLHLALKYEKVVKLQTGQKGPPPKMEGMSGGGMWIDTGKGFVLTAIVTNQIPKDRIVFGNRLSIVTNILKK